MDNIENQEEPVVFKGFDFGSLLSLQSATDEEVDNYEKESELEKKINAFKNSGVGKKYLTMTLDDYIVETEEQRKNVATVKTFITDVLFGKCKTLWLCGKPGTGKTLLGAMICRETFGHFCKSYQIQDDLEVSRSFSSKENKLMVLERYSNYPILVIDEIGKFKDKSEIEYLFRILNERYENEVSTVLISNLSKEELKSYLGLPLYDRFVTNCTSLSFNGESYRAKERS